MKFIEKRSKLIGTIGPSSEDYNVLKQLVLSGLTCVRANFSHGTHEEQKSKFENARKIQKELNIPLSIMLDTKGPEIRLGKMKDGSQLIKANTEVVVHTKEEDFANLVGTEKEWSVSYRMDKDVKKGDRIVFDDGKLVTEVVSVQDGLINIVTKNQHLLKTNKRINIPGVEFSLPFLSEKDKNDIIFGIKENIDYIAASFVNSAKDVKDLKNILKENNGLHIKVISKIESQTGINNIDEIIEASDGVMIARGDLGLEIPYYDVPFYEKQIIRKCRKAGKPVIVATQMLDSMEKTPQPTRAEVTDVYWATELGADSTMLSGESASGDFPVEAVKVMSTINQRAEKEFYKKLYYPVQLEEVWENSAKSERDQIAYKIAKNAMSGKYKYIIVRSQTGSLLSEIAKYRPNSAIIGLVGDEKQIGKFGITNSVFVSLESIKYFDEIKNDFSKAKEILNPYYPEKGDKFLVVDKYKEEEFTF